MPPVSDSPTKPISAPERSLHQRMEALQRANDVRSARAKLKRDLKAGRQPIHELLLDPPEYLETAKVFDLLLAVPKYGRVKVNKILTHMPDLPEQDDRRHVPAPARRARRAAAPPVVSTPSDGPMPAGRAGARERVRDHRPLGGRQGDADPDAPASGSPSSRCRSRPRPVRPGPTSVTASATTSSAARNSTLGSPPVTSSSMPTIPATATARCAPSSSAGSRQGTPVVLEIEVQGARQIRGDDARRGGRVHRASGPGRAARAPRGPRDRHAGAGRRSAGDGGRRTGRPAGVHTRRRQRRPDDAPSTSWRRSCAPRWRAG